MGLLLDVGDYGPGLGTWGIWRSKWGLIFIHDRMLGLFDGRVLLAGGVGGAVYSTRFFMHVIFSRAKRCGSFVDYALNKAHASEPVPQESAPGDLQA